MLENRSSFTFVYVFSAVLAYGQTGSGKSYSMGFEGQRMINDITGIITSFLSDF
jgi:hypothetical protein